MVDVGQKCRDGEAHNLSHLEEALQYFNRGWYPIPLCWPDRKGQCGCLRRHVNPKEIGKAPLVGKGFLNRIPTAREVKEWWTTWPEANIGVLLEPSGIIVMDLDGQEAIEEAATLIHPHTGPVARTGRQGGGVHYYFKKPDGLLAGDRLKTGKSRGIDIKIQGYVVLPPSRHRSLSSYTWVAHPDHTDLTDPPDWVIGQLKARKPTETIGQTEKQMMSVHLEALPLPENLISLIQKGKEADPGKYPTRSEAVFAVNQRLLRLGIPDETIVSILLDERFGISAKPREKGERWVWGEIRRAREKAAEGRVFANKTNDQVNGNLTQEQVEASVWQMMENARKGNVHAVYDHAYVLQALPAKESAKLATSLKELLGNRLNLQLLRKTAREEWQKITRQSQGGSSPFGTPAGRYKVKNGCMYMDKDTRDGVIEVPLCNFTAKITRENVYDDGAEKQTVFNIAGFMPNGEPLPEIEVPAEKYPSMNWITAHWGTRAVVYAGQGTKDHLRVAIQTLSGSVPRKTIYRHVGWRNMDGRWIFLHGDGGIGPEGPVKDIWVELHEGLDAYRLPEPLKGDALRQAIGEELELLHLAPPTIMFPLLAGVFRAPLGEVKGIDLTLFLCGQTGSQKSELTALAQAHFGPDFHGKHLPGNWSTTANTLEKQL